MYASLKHRSAILAPYTAVVVAVLRCTTWCGDGVAYCSRVYAQKFDYSFLGKESKNFF
jgi:hypothetical protein